MGDFIDLILSFFSSSNAVEDKDNKEMYTTSKVAKKARKKQHEWQDINEQIKFVCEKGKVSCPYASEPTGDIVVTSTKVKLQDVPYVTAGDNKGAPNPSILFNGQCTHSKWGNNKPMCSGVISPTQWTSISKTNIDVFSALLRKSTIKCTHSNEDISIVHSGQKAYLSKLEPNVVKIESPYLFYNEDGTYLSGRESEISKVYITEETFDDKAKKSGEEWDTIKEKATELRMDYGNLKEIAAIANGEAWQAEPNPLQKDELFGIACATVNYIDKYKKEKATNLQKGFSYARDNKVKEYQNIKDKKAKEKNSNWREQTAMAAGINALLGKNDISNGACVWDGIDVMQNDKHYRYRAHSSYSYIKGIYDPLSLRIPFLANAKAYSKVNVKILKVVNEKVEWDLAIETSSSIENGHKANLKKFAIKSLEDGTIISKEQTKAIYKGPGHNLWYYPKRVSLFDVVAQHGLTIFYKQTDKLDADEVLKY